MAEVAVVSLVVAVVAERLRGKVYNRKTLKEVQINNRKEPVCRQAGPENAKNIFLKERNFCNQLSAVAVARLVVAIGPCAVYGILPGI